MEIRKAIMTAAVILILAVLFILHINAGSLDLGHRELYLIVSDSMDNLPLREIIPCIPIGSLVMVDTGPIDIRIGDVVGYRTPVMDSPVFHRVIAMDSGTIMVKGDGLSVAEDILSKDVVGKVVGVDTVVGRIILMFRSNPWLLLTLIPVLFLDKLLKCSRRTGIERHEEISNDSGRPDTAGNTGGKHRIRL